MSLEQHSHRAYHDAQRASQVAVQGSRPFSDLLRDDGYGVTSSFGSRRGSEASSRRVIDVDSQ